jgi:hypothetical protein
MLGQYERQVETFSLAPVILDRTNDQQGRIVSPEFLDSPLACFPSDLVAALLLASLSWVKVSAIYVKVSNTPSDMIENSNALAFRGAVDWISVKSFL